MLTALKLTNLLPSRLPFRPQNSHKDLKNTNARYLIHINTSERNRGMDIHQLKQRIDASGKKTPTNHRPVRFDCSGGGSYQNEVREG